MIARKNTNSYSYIGREPEKRRSNWKELEVRKYWFGAGAESKAPEKSARHGQC